VHLFGTVRDEWIAEDLDGWLRANAIYPGVADAVREAMEDNELYIVTTKQARSSYYRASRCVALAKQLQGTSRHEQGEPP
jgi:hypothetical protein